MTGQLLIDSAVAHDSPSLVLFDKDGTLIDIHHYWASMIRIRSELIVERCVDNQEWRETVKSTLVDVMGVNERTGRMKPEGPVGVLPRSSIVNLAAQTVRDVGPAITNEEMEDLFYEVDLLTADNLSPLLRILPGTIPLLQRLVEFEIAATIVSTDITSRARKAMQALNLDSFFVDIIGGDQVENAKPAADLAILALKRLDCQPRDAILIGDHPVDIQMGINADIGLNVGVLTGLADELAFRSYDCRIISDLTHVEIRC